MPCTALVNCDYRWWTKANCTPVESVSASVGCGCHPCTLSEQAIVRVTLRRVFGLMMLIVVLIGVAVN